MPKDTTKSDTARSPKVVNPLRRCVFCMKTEREVPGLVESEITGARICNECIGVAAGVLDAGRIPWRFARDI